MVEDQGGAMVAVRRRWRSGVVLGLSCIALGAVVLPTNTHVGNAARPKPTLVDEKRLLRAIADFDAAERKQSAARALAANRAAAIAVSATARFRPEAERIADELSSVSFLARLGWAKAQESLPGGYGGNPQATEQLVRSIVSRRYRYYRKDAGAQLLGEVARADAVGPMAKAAFATAFSTARLDLSRHLILHLPSSAKVFRKFGQDAALRMIKKLPITQLDGPVVMVGDVIAFALNLYELYGAAVSAQSELRLAALTVTREFYAVQIERDLKAALNSLNYGYANLRQSRCRALVAAYAADSVPSLKDGIDTRCPQR